MILCFNKTSGYTGQLNNLDYTVCIDQEYGFCGTEFYQELEPGSFSLTNKTDLAENFQVRGSGDCQCSIRFACSGFEC